jgi:serine/threonine protein kinase
MAQSENHFDEQWLQVKFIFDTVKAVPVDERDPILQKMCNGDRALFDEVSSLLEASDAEELLAKSLAHAVPPRARGTIPRSVGPFELDHLLGRGGMGVVYLAHRADGQFQQQVAIKLIDIPFVTDLFERQFRMERQILARLTHPFIARMLDGGVSADGELLLAMEYIDGISILNYCTQNTLSLRARLQLFMDVCGAVQYAHQNLVIHRDLKPDNILVLEDGTPRLLDFGTAKLLTTVQEDSPSEFTQHGMRSFTPQYASPEQVLGKSISTATDVYSLGVILFQLLAEAPPYVLKEQNVEEMLRVICYQEPPKPSAVAVSAEPPDSDLDSIVLKALRKTPEERYLSAEQLSADVQAWLDGQPVLARQGNLRYFALKFIKRNKLSVSAAVLLFAVLLCGIAGVLWQSRIANLQRIRAEVNVRQMCDLSSSFLSEVDLAVKQLPNSTSIRHLMAKRVVEHLDSVSRNAAKDRLTRLYLVKAYLQLGRLQGSSAEQSIGDLTGALPNVDKAVAMAYELKSEYPNDREVTDAEVLAIKTKSLMLYALGEPDQAISFLAPAIDILSGEAKSPKATTTQIVDAAYGFLLLGTELGDPETPSRGDYSAALKAFKESSDLFTRALAIDPGCVEASVGNAKVSLHIGHIMVFTDPTAAIDELRKTAAQWDALPVSARSDAESKIYIQAAGNWLGKALRQTRDYHSAISTLEKTRKSMEEGVTRDAADSRALTYLVAILGDEAEVYLDMLNPLLNSKSGEGRQENRRRATELLQRSANLTKKLVAMDPNESMFSAYLAYANALSSTLAASTGSPNRNYQLAAASVSRLKTIASRNDVSSEDLYRASSVMVSVLPAELRDSRVAVDYAERLAARSHRQDPNSLLILAQAYLEDGEFQKAAQTAQEGLAHLAPQPPGTPAVRCRVLLEYTLKTISSTHS